MGRPRFLVYGRTDSCLQDVAQGLSSHCDVQTVTTLSDAVAALRSGDVHGFCVLNEGASASDFLLETGGILKALPQGIALLDLAGIILWTNPQFTALTGATSAVGASFFDAFGRFEFLPGEYSPLQAALNSNQLASATVKKDDKTYLTIDAKPIPDPVTSVQSYLLVSIRDVSSSVTARQKIDAIYAAGFELGDLQPEEVVDLSVEDRVELLKDKILRYTKDLLKFETVEIRLLDEESGELKPLLSVGMGTAAERTLLARPEDNGVTGYVATTGQSYLCQDTKKDCHYLPGAPGARSSLTVPLVLHEQILGTFNVESTKPDAFSESDLRFLELFSREVAVALNTLELLMAEKVTTAANSTKQILFDVADPVDEVLNDATYILEKFGDKLPAACARLQNILKHTREIREAIRKTGEFYGPAAGKGPTSQLQHPKLRNRRVLVVDPDREIRRSAHELLGRFGVSVETAHNGEEALMMIRTHRYDAVVADIRLPDLKGAEFFQRVMEISSGTEVILSAGFGYDANHSIVKARQMGLKSVIYKPFRPDQLIKAVESAAGNGSGNSGVFTAPSTNGTSASTPAKI
jgi:CheY-like chemotaxis protein